MQTPVGILLSASLFFAASACGPSQHEGGDGKEQVTQNHTKPYKADRSDSTVVQMETQSTLQHAGKDSGSVTLTDTTHALPTKWQHPDTTESDGTAYGWEDSPQSDSEGEAERKQSEDDLNSNGEEAVPDSLDAYPEDAIRDADYGNDGSDNVLAERMYRSDIVRVLSPNPAGPMDSVLFLVEQKMSLRAEAPPEKIIVERWVSPVNFRGYKFNLRKLLVYGLESRSDIYLYHYLETYYFSIDENFYSLHESAQPMEFESVRDTALTNYLITFVDSL